MKHLASFPVYKYVVSTATIVSLLLLFTILINEKYGPTTAYAQGTATPITLTPIIQFPVVPDAPISGYVDHKDSASNLIQYYDGRSNPNTNAGFAFTCSSPSMNDWVGCTDNTGGETSCPDSKELWYDAHGGTDFEYFPDWHTGNTCNVNLHPSGTYNIPIFAAAGGYILDINTTTFNGYFYKITSDANGSSSSNADDVETWYLHLRSSSGVLPIGGVSAGDFIAYGEQTGYASTPHLHLHVKRRINGSMQVVDPFGWTVTSASDPYPYKNQSLWSFRNYAPYTIQTCTSGCVVTQ